MNFSITKSEPASESADQHGRYGKQDANDWHDAEPSWWTDRSYGQHADAKHCDDQSDRPTDQSDWTTEHAAADGSDSDAS